MGLHGEYHRVRDKKGTLAWTDTKRNVAFNSDFRAQYKSRQDNRPFIELGKNRTKPNTKLNSCCRDGIWSVLSLLIMINSEVTMDHYGIQRSLLAFFRSTCHFPSSQSYCVYSILIPFSNVSRNPSCMIEKHWRIFVHHLQNSRNRY